ncbi:unnamed protein product [Rhizoctonia solani]|uniref:Uncharacterized protein n=1 Tax=Rhizoctonia solani TaxID=456999 RepID=A0A8H2XTS3_9AGAM|nr:unnamed protein product [Rhizoctonia solani]CAE6436253.1 unnamed protein product [Rhizoctonia solani]
MQAIRDIAARRRSTVPQYNKHEAMSNSPRDATPVQLPNHSQNLNLPPVSRRSLKRLRRYYLANLSSKHGSTQNQTITSGTYHVSEGADFIRLETSENKEGNLGILVLESPRPNKGPNMHRLLSAMQSIGNMVPIAPNLGYFSSMDRTASESYIHNLVPTPASESITFQIPLPLDNVVVLAGRISSRRSRRLLGSKERNWFIEAMWEGLKRLNAVNEGNAPVNPGSSPNRENIHPRIPALVDEVMPTFGASLLHFHHKVLRVQQKRDHSMSASQEQKNMVRREIAERNQDIIQTQAGWNAVEQEREELRRKENQLQQRLLVRGSTMN